MSVQTQQNQFNISLQRPVGYPAHHINSCRLAITTTVLLCAERWLMQGLRERGSEVLLVSLPGHFFHLVKYLQLFFVFFPLSENIFLTFFGLFKFKSVVMKVERCNTCNAECNVVARSKTSVKKEQSLKRKSWKQMARICQQQP